MPGVHSMLSCCGAGRPSDGVSQRQRGPCAFRPQALGDDHAAPQRRQVLSTHATGSDTCPVFRVQGSVPSSVGQLPAHLGHVGALRPAGQEVQELLGVVQLMACLHPTNTRDTEAGVATCDLLSSPAHLGLGSRRVCITAAALHAPALVRLAGMHGTGLARLLHQPDAVCWPGCC